MKAVSTYILSALAASTISLSSLTHAQPMQTSRDTEAAQDCVVLLHGLSRTRFSMLPIEEALANHSYSVSNINYDSRDGRIEDIASLVVNHGITECEEKGAFRIHFVTHSLGGILVRQYFSNNSLDNLGRVEMVAPPNKGTEIIDVFGKVPGFLFFSGEPAAQLGTDKSSSIPANLPPVNYEVGVIAGDRSISPVFSWVIPSQDDGKVSVESTRVEGMKDFIVTPYTHTFIMQRQHVIQQILHFLDTGRFNHTFMEPKTTANM